MYRCKSGGSTNQPEPISIEFPKSSGSNQLFPTKGKGKKQAKKVKDKGNLQKTEAKKQTKEKQKKMMCCLIALQWAQESKKS